MNPALIVVRAGDTSLHPSWLDGPREFDLLISYYGTVEGRYRDQADYYHAWQGSCWTGNYRVCQDMSHVVSGYDHVAFCDDDVSATTATWNRLFQVCRDQQLDLASPSFTGYVTDDIKPVKGLLLRYTNVLELICPVFSQRVLRGVSPLFGESGSGWGLSTLFAARYPRDRYRTAIVDAATVDHARPFQQGDLYQNLEREGKTAFQESQEVFKKYGLTRAKRSFFGVERL